MTTSTEIKMMQKSLLDYSKIIRDTDKDLTKTMSDWSRSKLVEFKKDAIKRSRELRAKLIGFGIYRFGSLFVDCDFIYAHTDLGFVAYKLMV